MVGCRGLELLVMQFTNQHIMAPNALFPYLPLLSYSLKPVREEVLFVVVTYVKGQAYRKCGIH